MQPWTEVDDFGAQERAPKSEVRVQGKTSRRLVESFKAR